MVNLVFGIEGHNQNPVIQELEFLEYDGRNIIIPRRMSSDLLQSFLRKLLPHGRIQNMVTWLTATRNSETRMFDIRQVSYLESFGNLVNIVTVCEIFEYYGSLKCIEPAVRDFGFVRIHGSFLISVMHIRSFTARCVVMDDGREINIGRGFLQGFRESIGQISKVKI